jgi:hypothetical protein
MQLFLYTLIQLFLIYVVLQKTQTFFMIGKVNLKSKLSNLAETQILR